MEKITKNKIYILNILEIPENFLNYYYIHFVKINKKSKNYRNRKYNIGINIEYNIYKKFYNGLILLSEYN